MREPLGGNMTVVEMQRRGSTAVVHLQGTITEDNRASLKARLEETLAARPARIVLEMRGLQYISSAGLGLFLSILKAAHAQGTDVVVAAPPAAIQELFEITRLTKVFPIFETEEEACAEALG